MGKFERKTSLNITNLPTYLSGSLNRMVAAQWMTIVTVVTTVSRSSSFSPRFSSTMSPCTPNTFDNASGFSLRRRSKSCLLTRNIMSLLCENFTGIKRAHAGRYEGHKRQGPECL